MAAGPRVVAALLTAATLPSLVAAEVPPCATEGQAYQDPDVLTPNGGFAEDAYGCQMNCQAVAEFVCSRFTYFDESKQCWLAGGENAGEMRPRKGATAGPRRCSLHANAALVEQGVSTTLANAPATTLGEVGLLPGLAPSKDATGAGAEAKPKWTMERLVGKPYADKWKTLVGEKHAEVAFMALCVSGAILLVLCCACLCRKCGRGGAKKKRGIKVPVEQDVTLDSEEGPPTPSSSSPLVGAQQFNPSFMPPQHSFAMGHMGHMPQHQYGGYQHVPQYGGQPQYSQPNSWVPPHTQGMHPSYQPMPAMGLTPPVIAPSFFNLG